MPSNYATGVDDENNAFVGEERAFNHDNLNSFLSFLLHLGFFISVLEVEVFLFFFFH